MVAQDRESGETVPAKSKQESAGTVASSVLCCILKRILVTSHITNVISQRSFWREGLYNNWSLVSNQKFHHFYWQDVRMLQVKTKQSYGAQVFQFELLSEVYRNCPMCQKWVNLKEELWPKSYSHFWKFHTFSLV